MTKLIVQMIVKDEADRYLADVLKHTSKFADEIVITDDASTDNTVEIAREYTDKVYTNEESMFALHEGTLRQGAWNHLAEHASAGDIILCLDADEKLFVTGYDIETIARTPYDVFGVTFYHMWNKTQYRVDKAWAPVISSRLFRFKEGGTFKDRRLACGSEPTYVAEAIQRRSFFPNTGLVMQHLGYMRDEDKQSKYERYMTLDKGEFHARAHLESILDGNPTLVDWNTQLIDLQNQHRLQNKRGIYGNQYTKWR